MATPLPERVKLGALRLLLTPALRRIYRRCLDDVAVIFMLHRFADLELGTEGHDAEHLDDCLAWLRSHDRPVLSLLDLVHRLLEGAEVPPGTVCFTVDDAYSDFYRQGLPVFSKYDVPVTVFVPTGFVDGRCWLWWDKVKYVVQRTDRATLPCPVGNSRLLSIDSSGRRRAAVRRLIGTLKKVSESRKQRALDELSDAAEVTVPDGPPRRYESMTWGQIRDAEERGARFGPHSVAHPVLSRTSDHRAQREISKSWRRLQEKVNHPVPVYGYPQGAHWSFDDREVHAVQDAGLLAAVSTRSRYFKTASEPRSWTERWRLPRLSLPSDRERFLQIISGLLRLRHRTAESVRSLYTNPARVRSESSVSETA